MTTGFDRRTERGSDDPATIRSVAVTVDDVLTALEARQRTDTRAVLRVTPPFAGRMRARLHVVGDQEPDAGHGPGGDPDHDAEPDADVDVDVDAPGTGGHAGTDGRVAPLHLDPSAFVAGVSSVPTVDETEDELRQEGEYSVERHRSYHEAAVESWREAVRDALVDHLDVAVDGTTHTVAVKYLGRRGE
jgi:hypothetical protein